jgi:hypothetical protein
MPEIPPVLPFPKGGEPLLLRGDKTGRGLIPRQGESDFGGYLLEILSSI